MHNFRNLAFIRIMLHEVAAILFSLALVGCSSSPPVQSSHVTGPLLSDFHQSISAPAPPARMSLGQKYLLDGVIVKNTGEQTWQARGDNQVELTYDWMTPDGKLVHHGLVTVLPADVKPGQSVPLVATIVAPETPGHYVIRFTMIAEKIAWFSDMGGTFVDYPVEAVPQ